MAADGDGDGNYFSLSLLIMATATASVTATIPLSCRYLEPFLPTLSPDMLHVEQRERLFEFAARYLRRGMLSYKVPM